MAPPLLPAFPISRATSTRTLSSRYAIKHFSLIADSLVANADKKFFPPCQILEMDDDEEEREFSKSIVYDFFSQAEQTFQKMDQNL